jgi:cutinase
VVGGYSQGASVVNIVAGFDGVNWGDPLPAEYMNNVAAVATFGDVADRTGGAPPTQKSPLSAKAIDLCNPSDPVCHAGPGNAWSGHTDGYVPAYTDQAAAFVAAALLAGSGGTAPGYGSQMPEYGPQSGYGPGSQSEYGPQTPPGYGSEAPGSDSPEPGSDPWGDGSTPSSSSPVPGLF